VSSTRQTSPFKGTHLRLKQGAKDKSKPKRAPFFKSRLKCLPRGKIPAKTYGFPTASYKTKGLF
jgi:hypothetical protein